jgi:hypothetical protein
MRSQDLRKVSKAAKWSSAAHPGSSANVIGV